MRQRVAIYERSARADLSGVRAVHRRYLAPTDWIDNQPDNLQHTHTYRRQARLLHQEPRRLEARAQPSTATACSAPWPTRERACTTSCWSTRSTGSPAPSAAWPRSWTSWTGTSLASDQTLLSCSSATTAPPARAPATATPGGALAPPGGHFVRPLASLTEIGRSNPPSAAYSAVRRSRAARMRACVACGWPNTRDRARTVPSTRQSNRSPVKW